MIDYVARYPITDEVRLIVENGLTEMIRLSGYPSIVEEPIGTGLVKRIKDEEGQWGGFKIQGEVNLINDLNDYTVKWPWVIRRAINKHKLGWITPSGDEEYVIIDSYTVLTYCIKHKDASIPRFFLPLQAVVPLTIIKGSRSQAFISKNVNKRRLFLIEDRLGPHQCTEAVESTVPYPDLFSLVQRSHDLDQEPADVQRKAIINRERSYRNG